MSRYAKQTRFAPLGEQGQAKLVDARVLVIGCGALGSVIANTLVRAGVGFVRIVDRDYLELSNLQRQVLYDEADVSGGLPKAIIAAEKLRRVNSEITIEPVVADVTHKNIAELAGDVDAIVDGLDNFETRLLVNDYAIQTGTPWVYGGCVGAEGQVLTVLPGETACLACLVPEPPPPGAAPTCDTAGVLGPAVNIVASLQAMEALKLLSGNRADVNRELVSVDLWRNRLRTLNIDKLHEPGTCRACHDREFPWLEGKQGSQAAVLCGRNAVQLRSGVERAVDLDATAAALVGVGQISINPFLLRLQLPEHQITLFRDGRAIVTGTEDETEARSLVARHIGG